jgi:glycosyltransferase involved in cell wall biosynthesis
MLITVFTPTYNRAHLLPRLYESLCKQTFKDFEWVIVDDGSSDKTDEVVHPFISDNLFSINYIKQENGGKHRAVNRGVKEAKGELFLILDSDDSLPEHSLETIADYYNQIKNDKSFGGVAGYMSHHDGTVIGQCKADGVIDATSSEYRFKYHATGDMCEVIRTKVLREFPFPEIVEEKFVPETLVLYQIASKYRLRWFKEVVYYRDYLEGGLTDKIVKIRMNSPYSTMLAYKTKLLSKIPLLQKIKSAINFYRFSFCVTHSHYVKVKQSGFSIPHINLIWLFCAPIGYILHLKDKKIF